MSARRKPLVLVVDDEPGVAKTLARMLEQSGYVAAIAYTGRDAVELASRMTGRASYRSTLDGSEPLLRILRPTFSIPLLLHLACETKTIKRRMELRAACLTFDSVRFPV